MRARRSIRRSAVAWLAAVCLVAAAGGAARGFTIEAERAAIRTIGGARDGAWNLWSNGEVGDYVTFEKAGTYEVAVRAYGSPAAGAWPAMSVRVDGDARAHATVDRAAFGEDVFRIEIDAGTHRVTVSFDNDAVLGNEDRNLYLDRIEVRPTGGLPEPRAGDRKELAMANAEREARIVRATAERIEKNRKRDAVVRVVDADGKPVPDASVAAEQVRHEFLFGCNIYRFDRFGKAEENAAYRKRFEELFNYATAGFYWGGYEPERGKPAYAYTDKVVAWCLERGIRMKGHPLLWGCEYGIPPWSKGQPAPEVQKQRVFDIMRRYEGKITFWEVVNEPSHLPGLPIDDPYRWAREADPKAYLIVNDYYVMADGQPGFFRMLEKAKADGVPFDGIGIQAHEPRTMRFPLEQVQRVLDTYAALGKDLHITEFTPCSAGQEITGSHLEGKWDEAAQADYAEKFYRVCFAHPAVAGITWWDLCDNGSWLKGGGMLRADLSPKPAYETLRKLIHEEWHTRAEGRTDASGAIHLRGFLGPYRVRVDRGGRKAETAFHLTREGPSEVTVRLP